MSRAVMTYKDMLISPAQIPERRDSERVVGALRAAGERTRLRVLALLAEGELAVGEIAQALGQSQPRVSRHLKLLTEAGLVERAPEGAWVFYRLPRGDTVERRFAESALGMLDANDPVLVRDVERLQAIRASRDAAAAAYFERNAANWERVRALHLPEADIDSAILKAAGPGPFALMVDVGVGQGRMIQLFANRVARAEGFDTSRQMLAIARASLDDLKAKAAVRFGDAYAPPLEAGAADLVTIHQVLHFLSDPARAVAEAARLLKPGGRLVIVDFAPHELEFLREQHAHRRLGFDDDEIGEWCARASVAKLARTILAPKQQGALTVKIWAGNKQ
jgi:ubiquinone/menaquinone biosynthesis C-methylase UbiE/DNA-binding transcriptional ArsR family regulator